MLAALLGLCGVLVGAVMTQIFSMSSERRTRRLEAMVKVAVASSRVIGAHERLYEIVFLGDLIPSVDSDYVSAALKERSDAHHNWRAARSELEILIGYDAQLRQSIREFEICRVECTKWVSAYIKAGPSFDRSQFVDPQRNAWEGMRDARHGFMAASRSRSELDSRWGGRWLPSTVRRQIVEYKRDPEPPRESWRP
jgi:hypothetical protein